MRTQTSASHASDLFKTPHFLQNVGAEHRGRGDEAPQRRHLLVISDFDHTLTRNDCGEQVARSVGMDVDEFYGEAAALGAATPQIERGGEFAALALVHPRFAGLTRQDLTAAATRVRLKDHVGDMYAAMQAGAEHWYASFYVVSAGPQETVREALRAQGVPAHHVIGSRFSFFDASDKISGLMHVSAGEGKVEIIKDLQLLLGIGGADLVYFGDSGSDVAAMRYVQSQGGLRVALEDSAVLRPYRSCLLPRSDDVLHFLQPVASHVAAGLRAQMQSTAA